MVTQEWGGEMGVALHLSEATGVDAFPRQHSRKAPAGSTLHAVADEGVPVSVIAEVIGRHLDLPVVAISPENAGEHFSFLAGFLALDSPACARAHP